AAHQLGGRLLIAGPHALDQFRKGRFLGHDLSPPELAASEPSLYRSFRPKAKENRLHQRLEPEAPAMTALASAPDPSLRRSLGIFKSVCSVHPRILFGVLRSANATVSGTGLLVTAFRGDGHVQLDQTAEKQQEIVSRKRSSPGSSEAVELPALARAAG